MDTEKNFYWPENDMEEDERPILNNPFFGSVNAPELKEPMIAKPDDQSEVSNLMSTSPLKDLDLDDLNCLDLRLFLGDESLDVSMSGISEQSNSPSPSPPPTAQSKIVSNISIPALPNGDAPPPITKPLSQTLMLNKVLQQQGATKTTGGSPFPGIFLIDSRPYQLIPNQASQNYNAKELQSLQFKVLSTIQQNQSNAGTTTIAPTTNTILVSQQEDDQTPEQEGANSSRIESGQIATPNCSESERSYTQGSSEIHGEEDASAMYSEPEYESDSVQNKDQDTEDATGGSQDSGNSIDPDIIVPNLFNETGIYDFKILLDSKEDTLKTPTWLVSSITKKLYTNMNKPIPFRVILNKHYPRKKFFLRALAVFKYPMSQRQNVVRCPNHLNPMDCTNIDFTHINHVIRADHPRANYESSPSGRLSVVVPLNFPENRNEAVPILLKFMCHNSCVGGIHRRPMVVLLTLELDDKKVGRFSMDVRVCACPSRDVKTEEKHHIARGLFKTAGHVFESRRNRKRPRNDDANSNEDEEEILYLPVRGAPLYNYLKDTKLLYLKHHPDYARRFPDPGDYPDPHSRYIDSSNQDEQSQESNEQTEEINTTEMDSPQSDPLEIPIEPEKSQPLSLNGNKFQRVLFLYPNSGNQDATRIHVRESDLPPEIRKRLETVGNLVSPILQNKVQIKKERMETNQSEELVNVLSTSANSSMEKQSKKKNKSPSSEKSKSDGAKNHLQVVSMPAKEKGALKIMTKKKSNRKSQDLSSDESEKVMLAARVLASHLGSQQMQ